MNFMILFLGLRDGFLIFKVLILQLHLSLISSNAPSTVFLINLIRRRDKMAKYIILIFTFILFATKLFAQGSVKISEHENKCLDILSQYLQFISILSIPLLGTIGGIIYFYITERKASFRHLIVPLLIPFVSIVVPLFFVMQTYRELIYSLAGGSIGAYMESWLYVLIINIPLPLFAVCLIWLISGVLYLRKKYPPVLRKTSFV